MTKELKQKANLYASIMSWDEQEDTWEDIAERAYIAGATENGVQWHDLRKDPNDLPKSSIFNEVLNQNGTRMYYDDVLKKWNMYCGIIVEATPPIAWCEIPQFKE